ncbi:TetR/AcrR family transcriptional regulator [Micromonospora sp. NPDC048909]|uniref:TetR/AcrR family transcriptional regulator n=1 Tax=Micromonospora sp. NPDC048909 TaxID=3155643 RepID=UPI0033E6C908
MGVGTLYRRFGTKEALLDNVVLGLYDELCETAQVCLERADAWDGLAEFVMELAGAHRDSRGLAEVTAACERPPTPELAQRTAALQHAVAQLTERARAAGHLRADVTWEDADLLPRAAGHRPLPRRRRGAGRVASSRHHPAGRDTRSGANPSPWARAVGPSGRVTGPPDPRRYDDGRGVVEGRGQ